MSKGKYRMLFSPNRRQQHGPKGPSAELFHAAASASMPAPSMVSHSVGCLTAPFEANAWLPKYVSSYNDPLYRFHQWQANLRILELSQIKSIPYVPPVHPFVERLIGTIRLEYLITCCSGRLQ